MRKHGFTLYEKKKEKREKDRQKEEKNEQVEKNKKERHAIKNKSSLPAFVKFKSRYVREMVRLPCSCIEQLVESMIAVIVASTPKQQPLNTRDPDWNGMRVVPWDDREIVRTRME